MAVVSITDVITNPDTAIEVFRNANTQIIPKGVF